MVPRTPSGAEIGAAFASVQHGASIPTRHESGIPVFPGLADIARRCGNDLPSRLMIDYRILVQAIADWRTGQRPGGREYSDPSLAGHPSDSVPVVNEPEGFQPAPGTDAAYATESDPTDGGYDQGDDISMDEDIPMEDEEVQHG